MQHLLGQLHRWRLTERLVRLAWGAGRWTAVVGIVLAAACLTDWLADRYLGSEAWRTFLTKTWIFAPAPASAEDRWFSDQMRVGYGFRSPAPAVLDDTPRWLHAALTAGQLALGLVLAYLLLVRPWRRTPPIDDLAHRAEKAIPAFGHRLVTAVQLNRPTAKTDGMSKALIADVTREAGEMAASHNLLKLVDYRRLGYAALVALPVLIGWGAFAVANPTLAKILLQRQALATVEIPRSIQLEDATGALEDRRDGVWPSGAPVLVRYKVTGEFDRESVGRVRVEPDGQPEFVVDLKYEQDVPDAPGAAYFTAELPLIAVDFNYSARLDSGRTRDASRVRFEAPPQLRDADDALWAELWLPEFLGKRKLADGSEMPYVRETSGSPRGEVIGGVFGSKILVRAKFSKPIRKVTKDRPAGARLVPIMAEPARSFLDRAAESAELEAWRIFYQKYEAPVNIDEDRLGATWLFPSDPRFAAYRIELTDERGFRNADPIRRRVQVNADAPPRVELLAETDQHPDPDNENGKPERRPFNDWGDRRPLMFVPKGADLAGFIQTIYRAESDQGVRAVNLRYRVRPNRYEEFRDRYPDWFQTIQHPRDDPNSRVFLRYPLTPEGSNGRGPFVPSLGLFEKSFEKVPEKDYYKVNVGLYLFPAEGTEPPDLEAGGQFNLRTDAMKKLMPDGSGGVKEAELEVGDAVELYVEVFDKNPAPGRPAGYSLARNKMVVTVAEAYTVTRNRSQELERYEERLLKLAADQAELLKPAPPKK